MADLPRKIFEIPFQIDPRPDIYKALTDKNAEYPLTSIASAECWLPDFERAIELGDNIYRVNVPGYFFKLTPESAASSGIVIDAYNFLMDSISHHHHRHVPQKTTPKDPWVDGDVSTVGRENTVRDQTRDDDYVTSNYKEYVVVDKTDSWQGADTKIELSATKSQYVVLQDRSILDGPKSINGASAHVAILSNQRRCPANDIDGSGAPFARDLACSYVVNTGKGGHGGITNALIPIIPGVATTEKPYGGVLSEHRNATIARSCKLGSNYYCIEEGWNSMELVVDAVVEAKGTYIFANRTGNNKIFFVPAKSVKTTTKPITKIRATTNTACTYHIPGSRKAYADSIGCNTSGVCHYNAKSYAPVMSTEISKEITFTINKVKYHQDVLTGCNIVAYCHDKAFDAIFMDIFRNPPSDLKVGLTEKFVAQVLNFAGKDWPGSCTNSISDINGHGTSAHTVFDPTVNGAT